MRLSRCFLLGFLLAAQGTFTVAANDQMPAGGAASNAATSAQASVDVDAYLAKLDQTLALANQGQYGRLERGSGKKLQAFRAQVARLLEGHANLADLTDEDEVELTNVENKITAMLRNQDKSRVVCKRGAKTGTRLAITECMTVAEREARATAAAEATGTAQRQDCIPTVDNPCG